VGNQETVKEIQQLTTNNTLANDKLDAQIFLMLLLKFSTFFEQCLAHPQGVNLY